MKIKKTFHYVRTSLITLGVCIIGLGIVAAPVFAGSSIMDRIKVRGIQLIGKNGFIRAKGDLPVRIKDNLKVAGDIRMNEGKTVDGIDVSELAIDVAALEQTVQNDTIENITEETIDSASLQVRRTNVSTLVTSGGVGQFTSMVLGADGNPVIAYYNYAAQDLMVTVCGSSDCATNNTTTAVDTENDVGNFPKVTIGVDGNPVIVHFDDTNDDARITTCLDPLCTEATSVSVLSDGNVGYYSSIAIGVDGLPVVSVTDDAQGYLVVIKCGNADCSSDNTVTNAVTTGTVTSNDMMIGVQGNPLIVYLDGQRVQVMNCGDDACVSGNTVEQVDGSGSAQYQVTPSVTMGSDNMPIIAYQNTDADATVLKCGNTDCTSGNSLTVIDSASDQAGGSPQIAIAGDGFPILAMTDSPNTALRVVKCGDLACSSSGVVITTVDEEGAVGGDASITVGLDGLPIVSEFTYEEGGVKVIKAANQYFLNYWARP